MKLVVAGHDRNKWYQSDGRTFRWNVELNWLQLFNVEVKNAGYARVQRPVGVGPIRQGEPDKIDALTW